MLNYQTICLAIAGLFCTSTCSAEAPPRSLGLRRPDFVDENGPSQNPPAESPSAIQLFLVHPGLVHSPSGCLCSHSSLLRSYHRRVLGLARLSGIRVTWVSCQ
ncbi:hypothetical protein B0H16DRAFT_1491420 [Mycena metata]|uniref:Secreted protein n=1 Tax=Mycena metata TaxID=1033252 RepID=A0AAD7P1Q3_9AGAR|nr:hypothetical protein B0H16DRAFT_1491420 [Mycena metata]